MYLKRITLQGFKSFADRTAFEFGPGRTVIVGPNGCGKSNVLDAVRWVLGEQSARTLRGHKMLDVIFTGSRTRKGSPFAEVELAFDNSIRRLSCDQDEVLISRTLLASGESEYRLNGNVCRLRDIRELLLDTGIGVDSYSVIEQGHVDSFLKANPLERRELFEEAAGISRYKVRRTEAQRKLERAQENLLRLNDVLDELEKRLRSVKLAAGKARNYLDYDARLRSLRATFSLAEYHGLEQSRRAFEAETAALGDLLMAQRAGLAERDAEGLEIDQGRQNLDERLQAADSALHALRQELAAVEERSRSGARRIEELDSSAAGHLRRAAEASERAAALIARIAEEEASLAALLAAEAERDARVRGLREHRQTAESQAGAGRQSLERERRAAFEAARQATLLGNEAANLERLRERLAQQRAELDQRAARLDEERTALCQRQEQSRAVALGLAERCDDLSRQVADRDAQLAALAGEAGAVRGEILQIREARSAVLSRLQLLADMEQRLEGLAQGARTLLEWRESGESTVLGLVADVLRVDDPRVDRLRHVLADVEQAVLVTAAQDFLAEAARRGGLPAAALVVALDQLRAGPADAPPGGGERAIDWAACAPEHQPLAERLLGRVLLVDDVETGLRLAADAPDGCAFVAPDGTTVLPGGQLRVGGASTAPGLIGRKTEIRRLETELDSIESQLRAASRREGDLEASAGDLRLQRSALLNELADAQRRAVDARTDEVRVGDALRRTEREAELIRGESAALDRNAVQLSADAERLATERAAQELQQQAAEARVGAVEQELNELEAAVARVARELTDALVDSGRGAERCAALEQSLQALRRQRSDLLAEQARAEDAAADAAGRSASAADELQRDRARAAELELQSAAAEGEIAELREQRQTLRRRLEAAQAAARDIGESIRETDQALRERELALRETQVRRENLVARIRDELDLDLEEQYAAYAHSEQDWQAVRDEIEDLRSRIARLGNVNLDALAELDELGPRHENLAAQKRDLVESIDRLEKLILELDQESKSRFELTFAEVRTHFLDLFRKVFGGGKADIILEDPENPLECGIDIVARPPGKEPQSITLLSGGEKTMTTVALLLAVFRSKPSPFAILDEVDAALDESNVDRFNAIIDEFAAGSQFIIITHHKKTMRCADVLYGVTMEEPGVSTRVSVRLDECVDTPVGA